MFPGYSVVRITFYLCGSSRNTSLQSNHEKTTNKFQLRNILQITWPELLKTVKDIKNKVWETLIAKQIKGDKKCGIQEEKKKKKKTLGTNK